MTKRSQNVLTSRFIKNPVFRLSRLPLAVGFASLFMAGCTEREKPPVINVADYENLTDCVNQNPNFADTCRAAYLRHLAQQEVESKLYTSPEECIAANPDKDLECLEEWEKAKSNAETRAPRFGSMSQCEASYEGCHASSSGDFFLPMLTGYMMGSLNTSSLGASSGTRSVTSPVFTPLGKSDQRVTAGGSVISGAKSGKTVSMTAGKMNQRSPSSMNSRSYSSRNKATSNTHSYRSKATTRTVSRGGFGSSSRAGGGWGG